MRARSGLVGILLLFAVYATPVWAQNSLEELRQGLVAPWLVTIIGDKRTRLLRIDEIYRDSEGSYLVTATYDYTDLGRSKPVRIELVQAGRAIKLVVRTNALTIIAVEQGSDGVFYGHFKTAKGSDKAVRLDRLTENQVSEKTREAQAPPRR